MSGVAWQSPVVFNRRQKMLIKMLGGVMQATPEEMACELFEQRVTPFMANCESRPRISVRFGDRQLDLDKKTKRNGRFEQWFLLDSADLQTVECNSGATTEFEITVRGAESQRGATDRALVTLLPRQGISVVSDIDDTIKQSAVGNRRELLHNTFLRKFKSFPQMAETYQHWASLGTSFHYVSASPWQLFGPLDQLREDDGFPPGTLHLRNFRLRDQLLKKVILHRKGKRFAIQKLIRNLSARQYILIGDSGEKDPEIYRKICRKHPGNIIGLFIRELPGHPVGPERWKKICDDLPGGVCELFTDGKDLQEKAACLFEPRWIRS